MYFHINIFKNHNHIVCVVITCGILRLSYGTFRFRGTHFGDCCYEVPKLNFKLSDLNATKIVFVQIMEFY